jgi:membrane-associated protein
MHLYATFLHIDVLHLVRSAGYFGLFAIIFLESGVFFGFFLPGGSLLFASGLLASEGFFNVYILIFSLALAAVLGDNAGYWFGFKIGPKIFSREDSLFFHKKHLNQTHAFYEKHGPKAIILGRFVPIVRTFVPILAGVGSMKYRDFLRYNIIGGILWSFGMTLLGYFLGTSIPHIERLLFPFLFVIIILSFMPIIVGMFSHKKTDK